MLVAHHSSLLRFWWRTTPTRGRVLAPVVAAGLGLRLCLMVLRRALFGRSAN
jgi:hypothetical protein